MAERLSELFLDIVWQIRDCGIRSVSADAAIVAQKINDPLYLLSQIVRIYFQEIFELLLLSEKAL